MSYAIAQIIYGVSLLRNSEEKQTEWSEELEDAIEGEEGGFLTYYSGSGDGPPAAFGVQLGEFDEACAYTDVATLQLEPTTEQRTEYQNNFDALSPELQKEIALYGEPKVIFLWSSS